MHHPIVSIITPSYEQEAYLPECIASVHTQDMSLFEHIIVDGGSSDSSKNIIEQCEDRLKWWCSEKDRGQSHAINKGLVHATGKVFGWINSDDALLPGSLRIVSDAFANDPCLLVLEGVRNVLQKDGIVAGLPVNDPSDIDALFEAPHINQQSTFYAMEKVKEIGGVDEALNYVMDYELWLQFLFRYGSAHLRVVPEPLAIFRMHEAAKTSTAPEAFANETAGVLHGLCCATGLEQLAGILAEGYDLPKGLRGIPVTLSDQRRIQRMVIHFLLKWNRVIHAEPRFNAMQLLLSTPYVTSPELTSAQKDRIAVIAAQIKGESWFSFRVKRKWDHLWR